jgi:hypothetical protein
MRPAAAGQDNTPVWVFDRLLGMEVPASALVQHILPAVAASADDLPDATAAKLRLRLLDEDISQGRVDETTLAYLEDLDSCRVGPLADEALVCPPPGLLLKVGHGGDGRWFCPCPQCLGPANFTHRPFPRASYRILRCRRRSPEPAIQSTCVLPARPLPHQCALCRLPSPPRCAALRAVPCHAGQD